MSGATYKALGARNEWRVRDGRLVSVEQRNRREKFRSEARLMNVDSETATNGLGRSSRVTVAEGSTEVQRSLLATENEGCE